MLLLLVGGIAALLVWALWVLYTADRRRQFTISLLFKVERGEDYLDPFLRLVCQTFSGVEHLSLLEIWIMAADDGQEARSIVHRLQRTYPVFRFRSNYSDELVSLTPAWACVMVFGFGRSLDAHHSFASIAAAVELRRAYPSWDISPNLTQ